MKIDEAIGAIKQIARFIGVLIGAKIRRTALRFGGGSNSRARQHFRNELHALAMIVAREILWNGFIEESVAALRDSPRQFSCRRIAIDFAAWRIRGLFVNPRLSKREGIRIGGMPAAMFDVHRMIGNR